VKRFYKDVTTAPDENGFTVFLDGRPVRTPARNLMRLPSHALARQVAEEWSAQGDELAPADMRLTRFATTAIDLMPSRRGDAVAEIAGYAATDLLCYRAPDPAELAVRQEATWQPWLDWLERAFGSRLVVTRTIDPIPQPEESLASIGRAIEALDDWRLVGVHAAATVLGSVVLALAMERGELGPEEAFKTALLDELYEIERWGEEQEQLRRHARLKADLVGTDRFLRALLS
jgi:chaperone required for assembly of F1-ATPase